MCPRPVWSWTLQVSARAGTDREAPERLSGRLSCSSPLASRDRSSRSYVQLALPVFVVELPDFYAAWLLWLSYGALVPLPSSAGDRPVEAVG